jgi:hypothetical protein
MGEHGFPDMPKVGLGAHRRSKNFFFIYHCWRYMYIQTIKMNWSDTFFMNFGGESNLCNQYGIQL